MVKKDRPVLDQFVIIKSNKINGTKDLTFTCPSLSMNKFSVLLKILEPTELCQKIIT